MKHRFSTIVVVLTLVALCFSVGEGLRLAPFPVSQNVEVDPAAASSINGISQSSVHRYGPLNVPAQAHKRSKRFAIDLSCPVSLYTNEFLARRYTTSERRSITVTSVLAVAFPSDRAPPSSI
jgi:hypothetical protein